MLKTLFRVSIATSVVLAVGASGCLRREVSPNGPTTKSNIQTRLRQQAVDKIDLLLAIDNSRSMGDKQAFLAEAVPQLVSRLVTPNCVDADGAPTGEKASLDGVTGEGICPEGSAPEFKPITDIHVGILSSSLGDFGNLGESGVCAGVQDGNDGAALVLRSNDIQAENAGFLAWFPDVDKNRDKPKPERPYADANALGESFKRAVEDVGERGCGFEAQLESVYQFLIAPQPWQEIGIEVQGEGSNQRSLAYYKGVNTRILQQRKDFLRPDSLVAVIMLTDEEDSSVDPLSVGRTGYFFMANSFPDGIGKERVNRTKTAPKGTAACENDPGSPDCQSCIFAPDAPGCEDPFLDPADDELNVRFHDMKRRYGVDPQYHIQRYARGLSQAQIADRRQENHNGQPDEDRSCTNPLFFGGELPLSDGSDTDEELERLCKLSSSAEARANNLVFFALIGGVPGDLLVKGESGALTTDAWRSILGADPEAYNYEGRDPRMIPSPDPRPGRPGPTGAPDVDENGHPREYVTNKQDLQYACVFPIPERLQRTDVSGEAWGPTGAEDCRRDWDAPLCAEGPKSEPRVQIRAKAYPTTREARVVRELGSQGILASLCPSEVENTNSPEYGYNPAVNEIVDRLKNALTQTCLPQPLSKNPDGEVPCLMLELMPEDRTNCDLESRSVPDEKILEKFREGLEKEGGSEALLSRTVCVIDQNTTANSVNACQAASGADAGWCYLDGDAAGRCTQQIVFNDRILSLARGSLVFLQCINEFTPDQPTETETEEE